MGRGRPDVPENHAPAGSHAFDIFVFVPGYGNVSWFGLTIVRVSCRIGLWGNGNDCIGIAGRGSVSAVVYAAGLFLVLDNADIDAMLSII